jgi:hypothetical protein
MQVARSKIQRLRLGSIFLSILTIIALSGATSADFHNAADCSVCHYSGEHGSTECKDCPNLMHIRCMIDTPNSGPKVVAFAAITGANSYADGDSVHDGVCEVCHTQTLVHGNTGDGVNHFAGQDCITCHPHAQPNEMFSVIDSYGLQSHDTHIRAMRGPGFDDCTICHLDHTDYDLFADGQPLASTTACDPCHSPDGSFPGGVDPLWDPNIGAKANWDQGVYEPGGEMLIAGKEQWCITCHDDVPASSNWDGSGVDAPNVDLYYTSGHGRPGADVECLVCHDETFAHIDGEARTYAFLGPELYSPSLSGVDYAAGYRLRYVNGEVPLMIPAAIESTFDNDMILLWSTGYRRCFSCHDPLKIYSFSDEGGLETNFKYSPPDPPLQYSHGIGELFPEGNQHLAHKAMKYWDSDWDYDTGGTWGHDSITGCPTCHNVHGAGGTHGSTNEPMIRDGRLVGRGDFGFSYVVEDVGNGGYPWVTSEGATQANSVGAIFRNNAGYGYGCICHGNWPIPPGSSYDAGDATIYEGTHTGPPSTNILMVSGTPWTDDELVGMRVENITDGSYGEISGNTSNTVTASLRNGTYNTWNTEDTARVGVCSSGYESYFEYYRPWQDYSLIEGIIIDDFSGYVDNATLRENWKRGLNSDARNPFLKVSGGPDESNCMRVNIEWDRDAVNGYGVIERSYDPYIDLSEMDSVSFYVKVMETDEIEKIVLRLKKYDEDIWYEVEHMAFFYPYDGMWLLLSFPREDFTPTTWGKVSVIQFRIHEFNPEQALTTNVHFDDIRFH